MVTCPRTSLLVGNTGTARAFAFVARVGTERALLCFALLSSSHVLAPLTFLWDPWAIALVWIILHLPPTLSKGLGDKKNNSQKIDRYEPDNNFIKINVSSFFM